MIDTEGLVAPIEQILNAPHPPNPDVASALFFQTLTIAIAVHGRTSLQVQELNKQEEHLRTARASMVVTRRINTYLAILRLFRDELKAGLVGDPQQEARAEVLTDFIALATQVLDEGAKDVAAVLAAAALEDALKRLGTANGLDVEDKFMPEVIHALKTASLVENLQAQTLQAYTTFRNKALHAEWDRIKTEDVSGLIGFTESFIRENLTT